MDVVPDSSATDTSRCFGEMAQTRSSCAGKPVVVDLSFVHETGYGLNSLSAHSHVDQNPVNFTALSASSRLTPPEFAPPPLIFNLKDHDDDSD